MPEQYSNKDKPSSLGTSRLTKAQRWASISATVLLSLYRLARIGQLIWSFFNDLPI